MVYSASAVQALDKHDQSTYVPATGSCLGGHGRDPAARRHARRLPRPTSARRSSGRSWRSSFVLLLAVFFFPERNGTRRWIAFEAISLQPSELAKLAAIIFTAALLERRMHRVNDVAYALVPIGSDHARACRPDRRRAGFRHRRRPRARRDVDGLRRGTELSLHARHARWCCCRPPSRCSSAAPYRRKRLLAFLDPWSDPLGDGLSDDSVADRGRIGRPLRHGADGRDPEALLPAGAAHRFHLRRRSARSSDCSARRSCSCASPSSPGAGCARRSSRPIASARCSRSGSR